ncbi:hypothetical protein F8388_018012 [Cannabis sativa]|uniref:Uncharacterized protein n=1 Tax=Cannabis sativa TaxID=3483 RepID=A0A7J6E8N7_CANSA|nr:hypothetical protein F8388_018012 [Cannabis sativa]
MFKGLKIIPVSSLPLSGFSIFSELLTVSDDAKDSLTSFKTNSTYLLSKRLIIASSRSKGLLVAARTRILSPGFVNNPSQCVINSFLIFRIASCSPALDLCPSMLSTSSTKIIVGETLAAKVKRALTFFSSSPNHFDVMVDMETLMKLAPASLAMAFAIIVLPVPGGPNSNIPLQGFNNPPLKRSGVFTGAGIELSAASFFVAEIAAADNVSAPDLFSGARLNKELFIEAPAAFAPKRAD